MNKLSNRYLAAWHTLFPSAPSLLITVTKYGRWAIKSAEGYESFTSDQFLKRLAVLEAAAAVFDAQRPKGGMKAHSIEVYSGRTYSQ